MTNSPDYQLTPEQYDTLWRDLGLGRTPYPLDVHSTATADERRVLLGQLAPYRRDLEPMLQLLDNHVIGIDLVADVDGPVRSLAASNGRFAVLATVRGGYVELTVIRPTGLSAALLGVLPQQDAGQGHALSIPVDALHKAAALCDEDSDEMDHPWGGGASHDERSAFVRAGLNTTDATLMSELATSRVAGGQFGVSFTGRGGRKRAPQVVTWFDTPRGRYLMVKDGAWLSIAPADHSRMIARIDSVLSLSAAA